MFRPDPLAVKWLAIAAFITTCSIDLLGHGPFRSYLDTEGSIDPPHLAEYATGEVGIVRPWFRRRYLVQAYRVFSGAPALGAAGLPEWQIGQPPPPAVRFDPFDEWFDAKATILGTPVTPNARGREYFASFHPAADYQTFQNCNGDAYANAMRTLDARRTQFGASSPELKSWVTAQVAVFANCSGDTLTLPTPAPPDAPPLVRADRAYQTAAAYFYAMDYDAAARRFTAIAADPTSPWRTWGQYLTARAHIRQATVRNMDAEEALRRAEGELHAVLNNPDAAHLHDSAKGLLDFIAQRARPTERLRALTTRLSAADTAATRQDVYDYQLLMDKAVGNSVRYAFGLVDRNDALMNSGLNDWILTMQGTDQPAFDHAWTRWNTTHSALWLVPVMWKITPEHASVGEVLRAAAAIPADLPAYPTIAFLRVRLLLRTKRTAEARSVLTTLPRQPQRGFQPETINLFNAARLMTAASMDEFLAAAPRAIVSRLSDKDEAAKPLALDHDGAVMFSRRLSLRYLEQASLSTQLPERIRIKIAAVGLTRSLVLRRAEPGVSFAKTLALLQPAMRADLDPYINASTPDDRRFAAVTVLVHTLGLSPFLRPLEDNETLQRPEPRRQFSGWEPTWWCPAIGSSESEQLLGVESGLLGFLHAGDAAYPAFVSTAERSETERELKGVSDAGAAKSVIAIEAIRWARMRPADLGAAEALSIVVNRGRSACGDGHQELAQQAFAVLHRQFPNSEWAKKTKYWYK